MHICEYNTNNNDEANDDEIFPVLLIAATPTRRRY